MSIFFGALCLVNVGLAIWNAAEKDMAAARFNVIMAILSAIQMRLWS